VSLFICIVIPSSAVDFMSYHWKNCAGMDNLHVRLNFNLSKEKGIKHHEATKNIMKLVKLQKLVTKGCKIRKI
jgi:hypothetical protein